MEEQARWRAGSRAREVMLPRTHFLLLLALLSASCGQESEVKRAPAGVDSHAQHVPVAAGVAGRWESAEGTRNGLGVAVALLEDGTAEGHTIAMLDGDCYVDGRVVHINTRWGRSESEAVSGEWTRTGHRVVMRRRGAPGGSEAREYRQLQGGLAGLSGVWEWDHPSGGPAIEYFDADGAWALRVLIDEVGQSGTWVFVDQVVKITWGDGRIQSYSPVEGQLVLMGSEQARLRRCARCMKLFHGSGRD